MTNCRDRDAILDTHGVPTMQHVIARVLSLVLILTSLGGVILPNRAWAAACQIALNSVVLPEGNIQYFTVGKGQPIVLLHGLFAQKEQWTELACLLSERGYAVYAPDLPGYGQSTGFAIENYVLSHQVDLLNLFTKQLDLDAFHIGGNSMGGTLAALYAKQYPQHVKTLAFIGAPLGIVDWSPQIQSAIHQGINPFIPITIAQFDLEMSLLFASPPDIPIPLKEDAVASYLLNNRHYQQVWNIVNLDLRVLHEKPISQTPTFIVWGLEDGVFNIAGKPALDHHFPHSTSLIIAQASHLVMLEKPIEIADQYLSFLAKQSESSTR